MGNRIKKILKKFNIIFISVIVMLLGVFLGITIEKYSNEKINDIYQTISQIAIVNLDEGIISDKGNINYATQFIDYSNLEFKVESLQEAREGIHNGTYAAYIIFPADFSANIESINNKPQKSILEYAINPSLNQQTKVNTINNINNFQTELNSNISYVYLSAILKEFHNVQDYSLNILKNDNNDLELINSIDPENLIQYINFSEMKEVNNIIQEIDLTNYNNINNSISDELGTKLENNIESAINEYSNITASRSNLEEKSNNFYDELIIYDPIREIDGKYIYNDGLKELYSQINIFNDKQIKNIDIVKTEVNNLLNEQQKLDKQSIDNYLKGIEDELKSKYQQDVDKQLGEIQDENQKFIDSVLKELQEKQNKAYEDVGIYVKDNTGKLKDNLEKNNNDLINYIEKVNYYLEYIEENSSDMSEDKYIEINEELKELQEKINLSGTIDNIDIDISKSNVEIPNIEGEIKLRDATSAEDEDKSTDKNIWIDFSSYNIKMDNKIVLSTLGEGIINNSSNNINNSYLITTDNIQQIIDDKIVKVIDENNNIIKNKIFDKSNDLKYEMENYQNSLLNYNPYKYINNQIAIEYVDRIRANNSNIENNMNDKNQEYFMFINDVYTIANENIFVLQEDMTSVNGQTNENINVCINELKKSRQDNNSYNSDVLTNITELLPYTKMGGQEYIEAYEYIISPVDSVNLEILSNSKINTYDYRRAVLIGIIMAIIGLGSLSICNVIETKNKTSDTKYKYD